MYNGLSLHENYGGGEKYVDSRGRETYPDKQFEEEIKLDRTTYRLN